MQRIRTGWSFYGLVFIAGFVTFALHEGGHWLAAVLLGYDAHYGLNGAGARAATDPLHVATIIFAGPAVTIAQGAIALWLVQARASAAAWVFLFWAAFMRLMATAVSLFNPNDEARISEWLGWGMWTLPVLVTAGLFGLLAVGSLRLRVGWTTLLLTWLVASAAVSAVVGLDMLMKG